VERLSVHILQFLERASARCRLVPRNIGDAARARGGSPTSNALAAPASARVAWDAPNRNRDCKPRLSAAQTGAAADSVAFRRAVARWARGAPL